MLLFGKNGIRFFCLTWDILPTIFGQPVFGRVPNSAWTQLRKQSVFSASRGIIG